MANVEQLFVAELKHHQLTKTHNLVVGFSGGVDSTCLAYLVKLLCTQTASVKLVHVNHHLQPDANLWQSHCQQFAHTLNLPIVVEHLEPLMPDTADLENKLRIGRYQCFQQHIRSNKDVLVLAHHLDDHVSTIIKRTFTAAGSLGLQGIASKRQFGSGTIIRPLLGITKTQLLEYAKSQNLCWIEDPSNKDQQFERNFIEQRLKPLLKTQWPGFTKSLETLAKKQREQYQMAQALAIHDLQGTKPSVTKLSLTLITELCAVRKKNLLNFWLQHHNNESLADKHLNEIVRQCSNINQDNQLKININKTLLLRYFKDHLYLCDNTLNPSIAELRWHDLTKDLKLDSFRTLKTCSGNIKPPEPDTKVTIRYRQPGQTIKISGKKHHQALKKLLQEWSIPPWLRNTIPLLYYNDQCVAVVGYAICDGFKYVRPDGIEIVLMNSDTQKHHC